VTGVQTCALPIYDCFFSKNVPLMLDTRVTMTIVVVNYLYYNKNNKNYNKLINFFK
jgi:hypothetical protein